MPDRTGQSTVRELAPADRAVAVDVVVAVSDALGTAADDLEPLESVIDTEALQTLVAGDGDVTVEFVYESCDVTVTADDTLRVEPPHQTIP